MKCDGVPLSYSSFSRLKEVLKLLQYFLWYSFYWFLTSVAMFGNWYHFPHPTYLIPHQQSMLCNIPFLLKQSSLCVDDASPSCFPPFSITSSPQITSCFLSLTAPFISRILVIYPILYSGYILILIHKRAFNYDFHTVGHKFAWGADFTFLQQSQILKIEMRFVAIKF